jgi:hypothetical protein
VPRMLGKRPVKHDVRTLRFQKYTQMVPPAPLSCDLTSKITSLGEMLNDQLGCCTIAGIGHLVQSWTAENGAQIILPDSVILSTYEQFCGYVPGKKSTDQGGVELDVLNQWRKSGVAGHTIDAYAKLSTTSSPHWQTDIKNAVYYFGGAYIGVELPDAALDPDCNAWDFPNDKPNPDNGHCVPIVAYFPTGVVVISWGTFVPVTWETLGKIMDEAYVLMTSDIIGPSGKSPEGFDNPTLQIDFQGVTS